MEPVIYDLLNRQKVANQIILWLGGTFAHIITEKLYLSTPAVEEPTNLQFPWQEETPLSRSSFHF